MPTTRKPRTSSGPLAAGAQKTLTFSTALSKPHSSPALKDKSNATSQSSPVIPTKEIEINPSINDKDVSTEKATVTAGKAKSAEEIKAEKVTDAQVRRYWREREAERKSARVHQEDLSVEEKILRLFDMSSQFGVCFSAPYLLSFPPHLFLAWTAFWLGII